VRSTAASVRIVAKGAVIAEHALVDEVQHVHDVVGLAEALDAANSLREARWVPGQVRINERTPRLQVQPQCCGSVQTLG